MRTLLLHLILVKRESLIKKERNKAQNISNYLYNFINEERIDKYDQISGQKFSDEIWVYRNKAKIVLIEDDLRKEFNISSYNLGRLYEYTDNEITYSLVLNKKFP